MRIIKLLKTLFENEKISYLFFGALTTLVNIAVFKGLTLIWGTDRYLWANAVAWVLAVAFAYVTNRKYVFVSTASTKCEFTRELLSFFGFRLLSFGADELLMFLLVTVAAQNELAAKIAVNIIVVIMNYIFSKFIIFK